MLSARNLTNQSRKSRLGSASRVLAVLFLLLLGQGCNLKTPGPTGEEGTPPSDPNPKTDLKGGIPNVGNTCYMNSVLQVIARLYPDIFSEANEAKALAHNASLKPALQEESATITALAQAGRAIVARIKDHKEDATEAEAKAFRQPLLDTGKVKADAQEDAHEILSYVFDAMAMPKMDQRNIMTSTSDPPLFTSPNVILNKGQYNLLPVGLDGANERSMTELVKQFFQPEDIQDYRYDKSDSNKKGPASRQEQIGNPTVLKNGVLPIHLKRASVSGGTLVKVGTAVKQSFQLSIDAEYIIGAAGPVSYQLVAFIHHSGNSLKSGHYVAYVRNSEGQWVLYNDSSVSTVTPGEAEKRASEAYLYFYKEASAAPTP